MQEIKNMKERFASTLIATTNAIITQMDGHFRTVDKNPNCSITVGKELKELCFELPIYGEDEVYEICCQLDNDFDKKISALNHLLLDNSFVEYRSTEVESFYSKYFRDISLVYNLKSHYKNCEEDLISDFCNNFKTFKDGTWCIDYACMIIAYENCMNILKFGKRAGLFNDAFEFLEKCRNRLNHLTLSKWWTADKILETLYYKY